MNSDASFKAKGEPRGEDNLTLGGQDLKGYGGSKVTQVILVDSLHLMTVKNKHSTDILLLWFTLTGYRQQLCLTNR